MERNNARADGWVLVRCVYFAMSVACEVEVSWFSKIFGEVSEFRGLVVPASVAAGAAQQDGWLFEILLEFRFPSRCAAVAVHGRLNRVSAYCIRSE